MADGARPRTEVLWMNYEPPNTALGVTDGVFNWPQE